MKKNLALAAVLSAAVAAAGCGSSKGTSQTNTNQSAAKVGFAKVSAALNLATEVDHVTLTINTTPATTQALTTTDNIHYSALVSNIPAGGPYTFTVEGFNASNTVVLSGQATNVTIVANQTAQVAIVLQEPTPPTGARKRLPVVDGLSSSAALVAQGTPVNISVTAHSPEAHALTYLWASSCGGSFASASSASTVWTSPATDGVCQLSAKVIDAMNVTSVTGYLVITVQTSAQVGTANVTATVDTYPVVTVGSVDELVVTASPAPAGLAVGITADLVASGNDPDGNAVTTTWTSNCGGSFAAPDQNSVVRFTNPNPAAVCVLTFAVSDGTSHTTSGAVELSGVACAGVTCQAGQVCDPADGQCKSDPCAGVTCNQPTDCHVAAGATCAAGVCSYPTLASAGTACTGGTCDANGACIPTVDPCAGVVCNQPAACHVEAGATCSAGVCSYPLASAGTACTGGTCDATGACIPTVDPCAGVVCNQPPACRVETGATCSAGVCSYPTLAAVGTACTGGTCDASGACVPSAVVLVPHPQVATHLGLPQLNGLAMDLNGASYVAGPLSFTRTFDGITLTPDGSTDAFVGKYDWATRAAVWAFHFGGGVAAENSTPSDQIANGSAVTLDGTVAVIGTTDGAVVGNGINIPNAGAQSFLMALNSSTGAGLWSKGLNIGTNAVLVSVAANPNRNVIAVCGYTDQAATALVPNAVYGGGRDALIAVFNSQGTPVWQKQLGGTSDEDCQSIVVDDAGDIYVAGKYNSLNGADPLNPGLGPLPITGTGTLGNNRRHMWVAKYQGTDGTPLAQASYGSGNGNHTPKSLAVDSAGNLVMGGQANNSVPFGTTTLTNLGSDAFVAKLVAAPPTFNALWAVRMGSTGADGCNSVAVTSSGDVLAGGLFMTPSAGIPTTGVAALTASGIAAPDAFLLKLDGNTGALQYAAAYGDDQTQSVDRVAVNRQGAGSVQDAFEFAGTFAGTITFPPLPVVTTDIAESFIVFAPLAP